MFEETISTITIPPEEFEQGSESWQLIRMGKITASRISDLMAKGRAGAPSASRANYMAELIVERLTGQPAKSFTNAAMEWGTQTEPEARSVYSFHTGFEVAQVGFIPHPSMPDDAGASPDGLIGEDGLVEIKCPNSATHIETLKSGKIAQKYILQMQWQMACTGRQWCNFVSYDPRMPQYLTLFIKRVNRDESLIAEIEREILQFLAELNADIEALTKLEVE